MITEDNEGICDISLCDCNVCDHSSNTVFTDEAYKQLIEYLDGIRKTFDIKLSLKGTEFQKAVWNQLCDIPYGETRSYSDIAIAIDNPKASRAVGMACNKNPVMIVVPCHRVIGKNKSLTGYALGIDIKKQLLDLEKEQMFNNPENKNGII